MVETFHPLTNNKDMNTQENSEPKCTLSNEELVEKVNSIVRQLAKTGGKSWSLRVPVDFNRDPDMLIIELGKRLLSMTPQSPQSKGVEADIGITEVRSESAEEVVKHVWGLLGGDYYLMFPDGDEMGMINYCRDLLRTTVLEPLESGTLQADKPSKTLQECQSDFWNFGYADYGLVTDNPEDPSFDDLDQEVVSSIFKAGWDAAQQQQPSSTWIKVSERLPELNQEVLVFVPDICKVAITNYNHFEEWNNTGFVYRGVTHWMPLPPSPTNK